MANFYSPYMKGPDWSQGMNDMSSQIMQMLMLKKLLGQQNSQTLMPTTPGANQMPSGMGGGGMGGQLQDMMPQSAMPGGMQDPSFGGVGGGTPASPAGMPSSGGMTPQAGGMGSMNGMGGMGNLMNNPMIMALLRKYMQGGGMGGMGMGGM